MVRAYRRKNPYRWVVVARYRKPFYMPGTEVWSEHKTRGTAERQKNQLLKLKVEGRTFEVRSRDR